MASEVRLTGQFLASILRQETTGLDYRRWLAETVIAHIPSGVGGRVRTRLYRALGMVIGRGTLLAGPLTFGGWPGVLERLKIGDDCFINGYVYVDAAAPVTVGNGVSIGHHTVIITTDHLIGPPHRRGGPIRSVPVRIEEGAWIAAGVTLLPGVTIGAGAVVAAGAVVTRDVPPNTLVGGVPARVIRVLGSGVDD